MATAAERREKERRREIRENASLMISMASLGVGIAAFCLNEKPEGASQNRGEEMSTNGCSGCCDKRNCSANRKKCTRSCNADKEDSAEVRIAKAKAAKKAATKEKKASRTAAQAAKQEQKALKMSKQQQIRAYAKQIGYTGQVILPNEKPQQKRTSWVAMEYNRRTGGDRQAIVCGSMEEAKRRAQTMKRSHNKGSQRARDCVQGYAKVDAARSIDIVGCFESGSVTRVRSWPEGRAPARSSPPARGATGSIR